MNGSVHYRTKLLYIYYLAAGRAEWLLMQVITINTGKSQSGACESKQYTGKAPSKKRLIQLDGRRIVMVAHTGSHLGVFTGSERKNDGAFFP